jgi:hypothetical protein
MRFAALLVVASTGTALAAAGCGSSRLSHEQFVDRADAICSRYDAAVAKLQTPRTLVEVERYTRRVIPIYRRALAELAALEPPKADVPRFRAWLRADRRIAADLDALAAAAAARQIPHVRAVVRTATAHNRRSNRLARQLGLKVCSKA